MSDKTPKKSKKNVKNFKKTLKINGNKFPLIVLICVILLSVYLIFSKSQPVDSSRKYSEFIERVEAKEVSSVTIINDKTIKYKVINDGGKFEYVTKIPYFDDKLLDLLKENQVNYDGVEKDTSLFPLILSFLPWLIFIGFFIMMFRSMPGGGSRGGMDFGKSTAKQLDKDSLNVTFNDVAGQEEAKVELAEIVDFLKSKDKYIKIGAKIPKGVLLVGPPGTGKTLLAKAIAGEAKVKFFSMSGSNFVEMFVGVGASRVRDLFEQGRKNSPCIIFIDELDAVGRTRGAGYGGGHDEREQTLNQMLVEMDGFDTRDGIIVIAATNRPDVLDPALLRPGRFDRQVVVALPDIKERKAILDVHAKKVVLSKDVDLEIIAKATSGCSGADLANLVNEAALLAARNNQTIVEPLNFEEARDKIIMGVARKSLFITPEEKLATAYHEAGHTLLHYFLKNSDAVHKVTIIPRGRALGVTFSLPEKDTFSYNKSKLLDSIKILMGGYAAETLIYKETTTGTQNDMKRATDTARKMVCEWGMSSLGFISFGTEDEPIFIGKEISQHKDYSESTASQIDKEVKAILDSCMKDVLDILKKNLSKLKLLAETLVEKETLDNAEIVELLGFSKKNSEKKSATKKAVKESKPKKDNN